MKLSVVLASCRAPEIAAQSLASLVPQARDAGAELIIARRGSALEPDPASIFSDCVVAVCPAEATIPQLRGGGPGGGHG